ncbi:hypothetical protein CHO01_31560 [Cellulomonas hominis]|uniref:Fibronectin type-III domain-containing protein n=1 Tax=Cellulomonas hominis TaxID=156981 RepID=A0A511FFL8_9CELL|nr:prepilin-type N-terminal cleavage/methylation domain-containing protein [Cellulomonas hominis]MBB5474784.1 hypothetical protein [Cellulomonas hominis]NKY05811.1 hypothetical protein [Cellulomonas hominis]GEL48040.1 hypothetical protein CHO01_31560 [Cellulomonas hominis]
MITPHPRGLSTLRARWRASRGVTLVELLVSMVIGTMTAFVVLSVLTSMGLLVTRSVSTTTTLSQLEDASGQLLRDVNDGKRILVADEDALTVQVVRDAVCTQRAWSIDGPDLVVETTTYTTERCSGGSTTARMAVVDGLFTATAPFKFYSALSQSFPMTFPVALNEVTRVTWDLTAQPTYPNAREAKISSGAAFTGRGASSDGTGTQVNDATRPVLQVTTARVGVDQPALKWTDTSPELTKAWTVYRIANPEGTGSGMAATWEAVMRLGPTMLTWTDNTLPDGYTAQYTVQATLTDDRQGPASNQVATGLRPAAPTTTATGQQAGISVAWTRPAGADSFDLYRDGTLWRTWPQMKSDGVDISATTVTWIDATGVGHTHDYRIVAVNRWERAATASRGAADAGAQTNQVSTSTAQDAALGEPGLTATRVLSAVRVEAGAFTAPAAPTATASPTTTWSNVITWAPAAWVGSGPTTKGGVHRDRGWEVRWHERDDSYQNLWVGTGEVPRTSTSKEHTGRTPGMRDSYAVRTCNASGCSAYTPGMYPIQRPAAPACSASGISTRAMTVTVTRPEQFTAYTSTSLTGGTKAAGAAGISGLGEANKTDWAVDGLAHATGQAFSVRNRNASTANDGWSDAGSCRPVTALLAIQIDGLASSTRAIEANAAATNGSSRNITLEGVQTVAGTHGRWDPLRHNTGFTVTARNSDGVNDVADQRTIATQRLTVATPAAPSCSASRDGQYAPTTVRFSSNGSLSRTSASATSAGYYSATATATNTNSDGFNTVSASSYSSCGVTVEARPTPTNTGATPGAASSTCAPYRSAGAVIDGINASMSGANAGAGFTIGGPKSGSYSADRGTYIRGQASDRTLSCAFYRAHPINWALDGTYTEFDYWGSMMWNMSGGGAV